MYGSDHSYIRTGVMARPIAALNCVVTNLCKEVKKKFDNQGEWRWQIFALCGRRLPQFPKNLTCFEWTQKSFRIYKFLLGLNKEWCVFNWAIDAVILMIYYYTNYLKTIESFANSLPYVQIFESNARFQPQWCAYFQHGLKCILIINC